MFKTFRENFWPGTVRGVVSFLVATFIGAICLMLGIIPEKLIAKFLSHPPWWINHLGFRYAVIVAGLAIIGIALFVSQKKQNSEKGSGPQTGPIPDMAIREVFFHINPDVLEDVDGVGNWLSVGQSVLNSLSTGELTCWGVLSGSTATIRQINQKYWQTAVWTYWFLAEDHEGCIHVTNSGGDGGEFMSDQYRNLQFNRSEVMKKWPKEK